MSAITYADFRGINNVSDPYEIGRGRKTFLVRAVNVDIDDDGILKRRGGYARRYTGTNIHSLWASGALRFFVENGTLKQLLGDYSAITILSRIDPHARMQYEPILRDVFVTNSSMIGVVRDSVFSQLTSSSQNFKRTMPPGQLLEWYHSRLYVARDNVIYASDVNDYHVYDERYGFRQFENRVTLMRGVATGMYVGTTERVFYLHGADHSQMGLVPVTDEGAFEGTGIKSEGGFRDIPGTVVLWTGPSGVFVGANDGKVIYLTSSNYWPPEESARGSAIIRDVDKFSQYLVSIRQ